MSKLTCIYKPRHCTQYMIFLFILVIFLGLSACRPKEIALPFETVERRDASGTGQVYQDRQPGLIVITTPEEVASLDALVTPEAQGQLQSLDYDAYFAIAVFQGRKPTTGYETNIERITRQGKVVAIYTQLREPKLDEAKGDEETSPYHLVQVQKTGTWGQPITFNLIVGNIVVKSLSHHVP